MTSKEELEHERDRALTRRASAKKMAARLARMFNMLEASPPYQHRRRIVLCMPILFHACLSCLIDMDRWRLFHHISIPDNHKRAAFLFRWLSKLRPVQLLSSLGTEAGAEEIMASGYFALLGALGELQVNMDAFSQSPEAKAILYSSLYRDILPETWAITFCLLEKAYPAQKAA